MSTVNRLMDLAAARFKAERGALTADADVFEALGIDSMHVLELLSEVEDEFEVEIPDYELRDVKTFAQLAACVDRRM